MRKSCVVFAVVLLGFLAAPLRAASWTWELSPERYKRLNQFERAEYDKASSLLKAGNFVAAAGEFEKFKVQFPDSPSLPYALFMRGYSLQQGKQRNTAVKVYQEALDYFADQTDDAAASLYFMGVAHLDNGDTKKGLQCMKTLVENKDYRHHPLAAGALRRLADNHWSNKEPEQAVQYWRQAVKEFGSVNEEERNFAVAKLTIYAILTKDYAGYENFLIDDSNRDKPDTRRRLAENVWQQAWNLYTQPASFDRKKQPTEKEMAEETKALYEYLKGSKPAWETAKDLWSYYEHTVNCLVHFHKNKEERDRMLDEAAVYLKSMPDKSAADDHFHRLTELCREGFAFERARLLVAQMHDRTYAAYAEYEILYSEQKYEAAAKQLETVEASGQPAWADRAVGERARIYREVLNKQPEAIALYERLNKPPGTLWGIQECYKRMGKLDRALGTLTEIENLFPPDAARAAWYKAMYLKEAGDNKKAIAAAKHVAIAYKSAPEAGAAHTMLEGFGIHLVGGESEAKEQ
jgi:tetratricopeptide (TPR) repeat protein